MGLTESQIELAKAALRQMNSDLQIALCVANDLRELRQAIASGIAGVLVADAGVCIHGTSSTTDFCPSIIQPRFRGLFQTILVNVTDAMLPLVSETEHAYLLPRDYDAAMFKKALDKALSLLEDCLELPLLIRMRRRDLVLQPGKIEYIESDLRKIKFHMGDETVEAYGKLSELAGQLPQYFVQCHKSFVVNMTFVGELDSDCLLLASGERIPVSQKRRRSTREALASFVGRTLQ
jgi:hypothetical protein